MKKINKIVIVVLSILCFLGITFGINKVRADSGWDSDYDSDSSWDSGGSDWSSSDYSSSHSSSREPVILFIIIIIIVIKVSVDAANKKTNNMVYVSSNNKISYQDVSFDILNKYGIVNYEFKNKMYEKYVIIQEAWMNFDYDTLRDNLTDELYNSYVMQLDALKIKNQKNIMSDFKYIDSKIVDIKEENGLINITLYLRIEMYDYVVDKDNKVVRGNKENKINIQYMITFVKSNKVSEDTICPNCGAKIEAVASGKCEYCGSVVTVDIKDYVMSRKTNIGQRRK